MHAFQQATPVAKTIRERIAQWEQALLNKDVDALSGFYAPDVRAFDAVLALEMDGALAYERHWRRCLDMCSGAVVSEIRDFRVTAGDEVVICHYLHRCGAREEDGTENSAWMRMTQCLRLEEGEWKIFHEHSSMAFEPLSGQVLFDLKPATGSETV